MGGHRGQLKSSVAVILDERTITVSAFAVAPTKRRVRRVVISLVFLLVLLTVGTGAAYQALLSNTERTNLKQAALLPAPDAFLTPGAVVKDGNRIVLAEFTGAARRNVTLDSSWSMADLRSLASALEGIGPLSGKIGTYVDTCLETSRGWARIGTYADTCLETSRVVARSRLWITRPSCTRGQALSSAWLLRRTEWDSTRGYRSVARRPGGPAYRSSS